MKLPITVWPISALPARKICPPVRDDSLAMNSSSPGEVSNMKTLIEMLDRARRIAWRRVLSIVAGTGGQLNRA